MRARQPTVNVTDEERRECWQREAHDARRWAGVLVEDDIVPSAADQLEAARLLELAAHLEGLLRGEIDEQGRHLRSNPNQNREGTP